MESKWGRYAALPIVILWLATPAGAQTATAEVEAEVVSPSQVTQVAAEWLMSNSPGVFRLRIPGAAQATEITLTAHTPDLTHGILDFFASSEGADALRELLSYLASSAAAETEGIYSLSGSMADGTMYISGVQMILMSSEQNEDGSGVIIAIIAFD